MKIPKNFNVSIINPILKDQQKSTEDINNIRPISISNCLSQIFEKLILINSPNLTITHRNQFGFKRKTSCNHAIFTLKETILNYTENKSGCKIASLDAEKAFDKTWRDGLFYKLLPKMDLSLWAILKLYYDSSLGTLPTSSSSTPIYFDPFIINVGVKQGGILSPFLFSDLIDDLITICINAKIGAVFNNINVSIIVYADDILLISPNDDHLQKLLNICSDFGSIIFNSKKSNIIEFGPQFFSFSQFYLNNLIIPKVNKLKYLGVFIDKSLDFDLLANEKFKNVQKSIFSLSYLGLKPSAISPHLQAFIYKTYCLSQFTYALETTTLRKKTRDYLNVSQNNLIRQVIGLPRLCHISNILRCIKIFNIEDLYISSKLSFLNSIKNNEMSLLIFSHLTNIKDTKKINSGEKISGWRFPLSLRILSN